MRLTGSAVNTVNYWPPAQYKDKEEKNNDWELIIQFNTILCVEKTILLKGEFDSINIIQNINYEFYKTKKWNEVT